MAINVYMVFFMSFNPATFRQYLWLYCVICFGLPAIPSFVFLFLREGRGLVYGDAAVSHPVPRWSSCADRKSTIVLAIMTDNYVYLI